MEERGIRDLGGVHFYFSFFFFNSFGAKFQTIFVVCFFFKQSIDWKEVYM